MPSQYGLFVGTDWAFEDYQICVMNSECQVLYEKTVERSGAGLKQFADWLVAQSEKGPGSTAIAIEVPRGTFVETLLERGFHLFSINPKQLDRFRDRHTVSGAKDDRRDAFVLADSLRTDESCFHRLQNDDPITIQLREVSRVDDDLRVDFGRLCNRLREQLHRYFPQMLELSPAANEPFLWDLVELIPEPRSALKVKAKQVAKLLRQRRIRRYDADVILSLVRTPPIQVAPGTAEAARIHIEILLPLLRVVHAKRQECAKRLKKLLDEVPCAAHKEGEREHRDVDIFLSMPGAGNIVVAAVLAETSQPLAERDYHALRTRAGIAPVTKASGKRSRRRAVVVMRRACNSRLRWIMYNWARVAVQNDEQLKARYAEMRRKGHSHGRALRGIADRLLRVLVAMLRDGSLYDSARQHGPGMVPA